MQGRNPLMDYINLEAGKCSYCGFCEHACPTLRDAPLRIYGPRGRVYLAYLFSLGEAGASAAREAAFTCLLCGACVPHCPAGIDVPRLMRALRSAVTRSGKGASQHLKPARHASRQA